MRENAIYSVILSFSLAAGIPSAVMSQSNESTTAIQEAPYQADANTMLLLRRDGSGKIADASSAKHLVASENIGEAEGKFGKSMLFGKEASHIEVHDFRISDYAKAFTIDLWINPAANPGKKLETIFQDGTTIDQVRLAGFIMPDGKFRFNLYSGIRPWVESKAAIPAGVWTNITIIAEKWGYLRLYVNGVLEDIEKSDAWGKYGIFKIGIPAVKDSYGFSGTIDEFRVSDTARIPLPPTKEISAILAHKEELKDLKDKEMEKLKGYKIWSNGIIDASGFASSNGCSIEQDGSLLFAKPGAWASYNFYVPAEGHYRIMIQEFNEEGEGELQVRANVTPITAQAKGFPIRTGGLYIPRYGDNRWHWHEMNTPYTLFFGKGWVSVQISFKGKENAKPGTLKINALTLTASNDYTREEMGHFRTSGDALKYAEKMQSMKYRMVQLEYPFFYESDITGKEAKLRALTLMKRTIEHDIAPNGFNWIVLSVYENGTRRKNSKGKPGVCYQSAIKHLTSLMSDAEDCIPEVISFAREKGIKVAFYMPYVRYFKNPKSITLPDLELAIARELIGKYKPDGLAYEDPVSMSVWSDLKKMDPGVELFTYTAHVSPSDIEKESEGNWNCITMDNLDYPDEIFPPIVCIYAADQKVMDPVKFNNQLIRMLNTPGVRGYYLYYLSPTSIVEPYASGIGELYLGLYSKSRKWLPEEVK